jgi:hypothetical protein
VGSCFRTAVAVGRGDLFRARGDVDGAVGEYRAALLMGPNISAAHVKLSHTPYIKGSVEGTIAEFCFELRTRSINGDLQRGPVEGFEIDRNVASAFEEYRQASQSN